MSRLGACDSGLGGLPCEIEIERIFGDHKNADGLMVAHRIDSGPKGDPERRSKMTVKKFEFNVFN